MRFARDLRQDIAPLIIGLLSGGVGGIAASAGLRLGDHTSSIASWLANPATITMLFFAIACLFWVGAYSYKLADARAREKILLDRLAFESGSLARMEKLALLRSSDRDRTPPG